MTETLKNQFRHATLHLSKPEVKPKLDDKPAYVLNRWKLYGYSKQGTIGDCLMPMPESENAVLRRKWDAWTECVGLTQEQAMKAYIQLVIEIDPEYQPFPPMDVLDADSATVYKTGMLHKQRDHFKGWRPRKFVLENSLLSYFVEEKDSQPKKTVDISGSKVSLSGPVKGPADEDLTSFTLSHPNMLKAYVLACSAADLDSWIEVLQRASTLPPALPTPAPTPAKLSTSVDGDAGPSGSGSPRDRDTLVEPPVADVAAAAAAADVATSARAATTPPVVGSSGGGGGGGGRGKPKGAAGGTSGQGKDINNPASPSGTGSSSNRLPPPVSLEETLKGIPPQFSAKIEDAVERLVSLIDTPGWEQMYVEDGMVGLQKPGSILCVRGDLQMQFGMSPIFDIIMDTSRNKEINPQVASAHKNQTFSVNTATQHLKFLPVWPTSARDMVNLTHWRLLPDNRIIIISVGEKAFDEANPCDPGTVRAELLIGGYVLAPVGNGCTKVQYVVQSDLKGNIPTVVSSFVSRGQPKVILSIRSALQKAARSTVLNPLIPTFAELQEISSKYVAKEDLSSMAKNNVAAGSNSGGAPAAAGADPAAATTQKKRPFGMSSMAALGPNALYPLVLFLPSLLYYALDARFRNWGFALGLLICLRFFRRLMLGEPAPRRSDVWAPALPPGRLVVRFPVDLGKLLRYVDTKHKESGVDITLTHVAIKAAAATMLEFPFLNGYMVGGSFYPSRSKGVDISVSVDTSESESMGLLLRGVESKPLHCLADQVQEQQREMIRACAGKAAANSHYSARLLAGLPSALGAPLARFFAFLGRDFGLDLEALGAVPFPLGVCSIVTAPHKGEESIDLDINLSMIPAANATQPPVAITIGGVSIRPTMDSERRLQGVPVLNMTVSIDSRACSLVESRKFCAKFQSNMSTHPWEGERPQRHVPTAIAMPLGRK